METNLQVKKILIIEDEAPLLAVLSDKLTREGFEVLQAMNGAEGLSAALQHRPHLILLDIVMPHVDGMSVLRQLRDDNWGRYVPVIIMTNLNDAARVIEALELGLHEERSGSYPGMPLTEVGRDGLKKYLETRLGNGVHDFIIKSNWKLEDVVKKVKDKLRDLPQD